jgi:hypothetical protein
LPKGLIKPRPVTTTRRAGVDIDDYCKSSAMRAEGTKPYGVRSTEYFNTAESTA